MLPSTYCNKFTPIINYKSKLKYQITIQPSSKFMISLYLTHPIKKRRWSEKKLKVVFLVGNYKL
jgi:hypothetical protein